MLAVTLFSLANAGPLADVARTELDNAREVHRAVRTAGLSARYKLSETCTKAHADAEGSITKARALYDAGDHKNAYDGLHAALVALKPCTVELATGPSAYQSRIRAVLRTADDQLAALDTHLKAHENEAARKAYGDAVAARTTARSKALADQMPAAVEDWYTMLDAIHTAIKAAG